VFSLLLVTSCGGSSTVESEPSNLIVATVKRANLALSSADSINETILSTLSDEELLQLFETVVEKAMGEGTTANFSEDILVINSNGQAAAELNQASIEGSGETYYLVARGNSYDAEGNCLTFATELRVVSDAGTLGTQAESNDVQLQFEPDGTTHQCSGVRCGSCAFTYNLLGQITGCRCTLTWTFFGYCNHTVIAY
jgi:hypothetical protein